MTAKLIYLAIILIVVFLGYIFKKDRSKKLTALALASPFFLALLVYGLVYYLSRNLGPYDCDGGALLGLMISFILLAIGLVVNLIYILVYGYRKYRDKK